MQKLSLEELNNDNLEENELNTLIEDIKDINEISSSINKMLSNQQENIIKIESIVDTNIINIQKGFDNIKIANEYYQSYKYIKGFAISAGIISITGPICIFAGLKIGMISCLISSSIGLYNYIGII